MEIVECGSPHPERDVGKDHKEDWMYGMRSDQECLSLGCIASRLVLHSPLEELVV